jgi:hypothetical protein
MRACDEIQKWVNTAPRNPMKSRGSSWGKPVSSQARFAMLNKYIVVIVALGKSPFLHRL